MKKTLIGCIVAALSSVACGDSGSDKSKSFNGFSFTAKMTRMVDVKEWVEVQGAQEWWFFDGGVFRHISQDYVEPQFYGPSQACNGTGSGTYTVEEDSSRTLNVALKYESALEVTGLCRMTDRTLKVTLQPSGPADVVDNKIVQRLERKDEL